MPDGGWNTWPPGPTDSHPVERTVNTILREKTQVPLEGSVPTPSLEAHSPPAQQGSSVPTLMLGLSVQANVVSR